MGTVYDEFDFEKGKALRSEPVEDLVMISIHLTDVSRPARVGALLQDERRA